MCEEKYGKSMSNLTLSSLLKRFLGGVGDVRSIILSTLDGAELVAEYKSAQFVEDAQVVSLLVPSFVVSVDQSSRFELGATKHAMTWSGNFVYMQFIVEKIVVSIVMDESVNIGLVEEQLPELKSILSPLFQE